MSFFCFHFLIESSMAGNLKTIYKGPMANALVYLKRVSSVTFGLSVCTSPIMLMAPNASALFIAGMMTAAIGTRFIFW